MIRRLALLLALAALPVAAADAASGTVTFCRAADLSGSFAVVPGSGAAGSISYRLRLRNDSASACAVTGLPVVRLLGRTGLPLPTRPGPARPGTATAVLVTLAPGARAHADARFSPDVPGPAETTVRACEPTAYRLRVTPTGGGSLRVPILPPTPVCEHGRLLLSNLSAG